MGEEPVTATVQTEAEPTLTEDGEQVTDVEDDEVVEELVEEDEVDALDVVELEVDEDEVALVGEYRNVIEPEAAFESRTDMT